MPVYPGAPAHQSLLRTIAQSYENDPRVRAVIVFGSLGRGDWDAWSDIDLDVIVADGCEVDVVAELRALCSAFETLGDRAAVIVRDGDDAGDVVLESLMQLSVRYHVLANTSPAIVSTMQLVAGSLDAETIAAAGRANQPKTVASPGQMLNALVRYAAVANVYIQRDAVWLAMELLHRMRTLLMELFAHHHGHERSLHAFESAADPAVQARLAATLPGRHPDSLRAALAMLIYMLETDLDYLSAGHLQLSKSQRILLARVLLHLTEAPSPARAL